MWYLTGSKIALLISNCMYVCVLQYNTIKYNAMQCNTIQYNTMQYNTIPVHTNNKSLFLVESVSPFLGASGIRGKSLYVCVLCVVCVCVCVCTRVVCVCVCVVCVC